MRPCREGRLEAGGVLLVRGFGLVAVGSDQVARGDQAADQSAVPLRVVDLVDRGGGVGRVGGGDEEGSAGEVRGALDVLGAVEEKEEKLVDMV